MNGSPDREERPSVTIAAELWRGEEPSQLIFDLMEPERPNIAVAAL